MAISPTCSHLLTGGQEKKVRIFDLTRPDADADFLGDVGLPSHDGTVKSVVWVGEHTGVSAGEDGIIKFVVTTSHNRTPLTIYLVQMVGPANAKTYDNYDFP